MAAGTKVELTFENVPDIPVEHQVAMARTTSVDDAPTRDSLRTLLMALQNAVGDGDVSHVALSVQVVVTTDVKDDLVGKAEAAGITPKVIDL